MIGSKPGRASKTRPFPTPSASESKKRFERAAGLFSSILRILMTFTATLLHAELPGLLLWRITCCLVRFGHHDGVEQYFLRSKTGERGVQGQ
jgi:hypothetical protein